MRLHHLLEAGLKNKVPEVRERCECIQTQFDEFGQFDFGDISNIPIEELNDLKIYASDLMRHDMFSLPYEHICYSFKYGNCDNVLIATIKDGKIYIVAFVFWQNVLMCAVDVWLSAHDDDDMIQYGFIDDIYKTFITDWKYKEQYIAELNSSAIQSLTVMLQSKGIHIKKTPRPDKLNIARVKKGKIPIGEINEISININGKTYDASGNERGSGSSKRLHWRRGHIRRLPSGEITNVRPCLVGEIGKEPARLPTYKVKAA
jgi:hypothetical protein